MATLTDYWEIIAGNQYLYALTIFIAAYLVMQIGLYLSERVFLKLAKKTKSKIDDELVANTRKPLALLILLLGARLASEALVFTEDITVTLERVLGSLIVIVLAAVIIRIINTLIDHWGKKFTAKTQSKTDDDLLGLFHRFIQVVLYFLAVLYVLSVWGVQIGPLLASLGVAGIAVAFALQKTLGDVFGGIALILDKAVRVGDIIQLEDGAMGIVDKVSLRSTKIKTFDGELMTVPNGSLADSRITNWHMPDLRVRINLTFGVEYGSDPDQVKKFVMALIKKHKKVLKDPAPYILFTEMADFSLNFIARFWVADLSEKLGVKDEMTTAIYKEFGKRKIGIPFPTRTVFLEK